MQRETAGESVEVNVIGGGLAGASAALAVRRLGGRVRVWEEARGPRHRVCGEFLSPEVAGLFRQLGVWSEFLALKPHAITRMGLSLKGRWVYGKLPAPAFGITRYRLDRFLLEQAQAAGAAVEWRRAAPEEAPSPTVLAMGRRAGVARGAGRLFGFKAYYSGPVDDAVRLFFLPGGGYVGMSGVEDGKLNVCGLVSEERLQGVGFAVEGLLESAPELGKALTGRERLSKWLFTGPVAFRNALGCESREGVYWAGDALAFIDPFTGSGMLNAIHTGKLAGEAAWRREPAAVFLARVRTAQRMQFLTAAILRRLAEQAWARWLVKGLPLGVVFRATRPRL